ncbi:MAG: hypothetical protein HOP29_00440 [Phycisphaerales bacterium]|nr:hypothetical protein [Phycisphaerales bacterium]
MSVRFIIGRAGTGKTRACLDAIRDQASASPVHGPRLILLVPEQAGLQMERQLVLGVKGAATHRVEVLSFRRLANRILSEAGGTGLKAINAAARTMLLRWLMARCAPQLRYYRRCQEQAGFLEQLGRTIAECLEAAIAPEDLPVPTGDPIDDPVRAAKLHDVRLLYRGYLDALGPDRLDPSQFIDSARARLDSCDWLPGAHIWVDGFAGFSRQEQTMLAALGVRAAGMSITVLIDPEHYHSRPAAVIAASDLFARTQRMVTELISLFAEQGIEVEPPVVLPGPPRRFELAPALANLERRLFGPPPTAASSNDGVRLVECTDRRAEVAYAVACIHESVRRSVDPLRYRDIGIVARNLDQYHELISAALAAHGIPCFIDRRRPISHHPLIELARGLTALTATDFGVDAVRALLKTGLLPIDDDSADAMENHLLATAICGRDKWTAGDWPPPPRERSARDRMRNPMAEVNGARRRFIDALDHWNAASAGGAKTGRVWAEHLRGVFDRLAIEDTLLHWIQTAGQDGDWEQAAVHGQVLNDVSAGLDDLAEVFGETPFGIAELGALLDAAMSPLTLGLAPPMLDQVLVGSIERSRHPELRLVILLGMNDGIFPAIPSDSSILNDDDRVWLERAGVPVGPPRVQQILEEAMLFYVACTRPGESLLVTYATADERGKALLPSPFTVALLNALPGLSVDRSGDPLHARDGRSVVSARELASQLAYELRHREDAIGDDREIRAQWNDLYGLARDDESLAPFLSRVMRSLVDDNTTSSVPTDAKAADDQPAATMSVSELETFAECSFKHFAHYRLRLRRRPVAPLDAADVGVLHHAVLERMLTGVIERGESLGELDEVDLADRLAESCRRVNEELPVAGGMSRARDRYLWDRCSDQLWRVLTAQRRIARAGSFRPRAAELQFGKDAQSPLPALELTTPSGRRVRLRGAIDRVELAEATDHMLGIVIDYKRKHADRARLDLAAVYHGLSLQLLGYALVLARHGSTLAGRRVLPIGAFYAGLLQKYKRVDHPDDGSGEEPRMSAFKLRGVFNAEHVSALNNADDAGRFSTVSAYRKRDGTFGYVNSTDVAEGPQFEALLDHTRATMAQLADRILDGDARVEPCRLRSFSPCAWCDYVSVCRYEQMHTPIRLLDALTRVQVFDRLTESPVDSTND